jgi:hypothetical protein
MKNRMPEQRSLVQPPSRSRRLNSKQALVRFGFRILILGGFAAFSSIGFERGLATLLWMSIVLCAVIGTIRREPVFGPILNHWDEAAAYAALYALVGALGLHAPA